MVHRRGGRVRQRGQRANDMDRQADRLVVPRDRLDDDPYRADVGGDRPGRPSPERVSADLRTNTNSSVETRPLLTWTYSERRAERAQRSRFAGQHDADQEQGLTLAAADTNAMPIDEPVHRCNLSFAALDFMIGAMSGLGSGPAIGHCAV